MTSTSGFLGVLMLDTSFPRPPGDIGNPVTFSRAGIPVRFAVVAGATPGKVVLEGELALLAPFVKTALELVQGGACMLTTSCGFLAAYQSALAGAVPVPVISSSILQCAEYERPGIVTIDAASLSAPILKAANVPVGTPVQGVVPGCEFHSRILRNEPEMDLKQAERDVVRAAQELVAAHPEVETVVLECTNMPPYRDAVASATGRTVVDIETFVIRRWRQHMGLAAS